MFLQGLWLRQLWSCYICSMVLSQDDNGPRGAGLALAWGNKQARVEVLCVFCGRGYCTSLRSFGFYAGGAWVSLVWRGLQLYPDGRGRWTPSRRVNRASGQGSVVRHGGRRDGRGSTQTMAILQKGTHLRRGSRDGRQRAKGAAVLRDSWAL